MTFGFQRRRCARCRAWPLLVIFGLGVSTARAQEPSGTGADYNAPDPERALVDYGRAAANVAFTNWAIWQVAWARHKDWAPITRDTLRTNLDVGFEFDQDMLQTNFFGHPYHGGLQFNGARGAGLSFWEAALYTFAGSFSWELFAEREKPSLNDLAVTVLGGIMLGEITHRLSSEVLDDSRSGSHRLVRELGAAAVNPLRGLDRLTTTRAFRTGPPPRRRRLRLELELGADRVRFTEDDGPAESQSPALLFAADVEYGDLLPPAGSETLGPFDFFELYAAVNLLNDELSGAHVYASGLLHGYSMPLANGAGRRDNDVLGFGMNYEYVGTNFTTYSGVGFGPVNHLTLRRGGGRTVRLSVGADLVPVLGASSTQAGHTERDYNFALGFSPWSGAQVQMGRWGELGMQMRHYVASVVNGQAGDEFIGSTRLWYELELVRGFGIGLAPTLVYRRGDYRNREAFSAQQLSTQIYVKANP